MTAIPEHGATPRRLLLATDLSARCDRALDRAARLANQWQAELVALNVIEPAASFDQALVWAGGASDEPFAHLARDQLARDIVAANVRATLRVVRSADIPAAIQVTAIGTQSDLVITGVSRNETLGRLLLGSTVEKLARALPHPLLVVRKRARAPYGRIVVATDFSESSRHTLRCAARLFPGSELILYHAHSGQAKVLPHPNARIEEAECAAFLAATAFPERVKVRPVVQYGAIESTLTRYVREHDIELVVMGSPGCNGIMSLLLGSTAAKLLDWLPCDMLLVRKPIGTATGTAAEETQVQEW